MKAVSLAVAVLAVLAGALACRDASRDGGGAPPGAGPSTVDGGGPRPSLPQELEGTPWGDIAALESSLWDLVAPSEEEDAGPAKDAVEGWFDAHGATLRDACAVATARLVSEPSRWAGEAAAFATWHRTVVLPRRKALEARPGGGGVLAALRRFDGECLSASASRTAADGAGGDPWSRYVRLRRELHRLVNEGLPRPAEALRAGQDWYEDHQDELRDVCARMGALAGSPLAERALESYTGYLESEGQQTVEKLLAKIPAVVPDASRARALLDLVTRIDGLCSSAGAGGAAAQTLP